MAPECRKVFVRDVQPELRQSLSAATRGKRIVHLGIVHYQKIPTSMRIIYTFLLCCFFSPIVRARIGEDETTIGVRYGKPVETVPTADPHFKARVYLAAGVVL